ncbi:MAG: hypothetical protein BWY50_01864 [Spirochaetes bacterium ADurb.Bin315]|nr:MAG: hypothetical protein BWY50_01864 [Spirochaetes bacterium ADurb.Bin315]
MALRILDRSRYPPLSSIFRMSSFGSIIGFQSYALAWKVMIPSRIR